MDGSCQPRARSRELVVRRGNEDGHGAESQRRRWLPFSSGFAFLEQPQGGAATSAGVAIVCLCV